MTLNRYARWIVVGSLALILAGCGSGNRAGGSGQGSAPAAGSGTSTSDTGSVSGSQGGSSSSSGDGSASTTAADPKGKGVANAPNGGAEVDGLPGDNTVSQNPADFATPQTKMNIQVGVDRKYQNGPSPEEIKKYNAISATPPKPVDIKSAGLPGNSGDPLFDNTGLTQVPKK